MSVMKQLLWQESPKPKRDFIKENARKFSDTKKQTKDKQIQRKVQSVSVLNSNRISNTSQQNTSRKGILTQRKLLQAFPIQYKNNHIETLNTSPINVNKNMIMKSSCATPKAFKNQACQTINVNDLDSLYQDSVIRYPSSKYTNLEQLESPQIVEVKEMGLQTDELCCQYEVVEQEKSERKVQENVDYVKLNMTTLKPKQINISREDPTRVPTTYQKGVVPKYLREMKRDKENQKESRYDTGQDGTPAQILLPDDVRKKLLDKLEQEHKGLIDQLNLLPFRANSLKTLHRKQELEKELDILEKRILNFSKEKVFITDDSK